VSDRAVVAPLASAVRQCDRSRERGHLPGVRWSNARHPVAPQSVPEYLLVDDVPGVALDRPRQGTRGTRWRHDGATTVCLAR